MRVHRTFFVSVHTLDAAQVLPLLTFRSDFATTVGKWTHCVHLQFTSLSSHFECTFIDISQSFECFSLQFSWMYILWTEKSIKMKIPIWYSHTPATFAQKSNYDNNPAKQWTFYLKLTQIHVHRQVESWKKAWNQ